MFAYCENNAVNSIDPYGYAHLDLRADIIAVTIDLLVYLIPVVAGLNKTLKGLKHVPKHAIRNVASSIKRFIIKVLPKINVGLSIVNKLVGWINNITGVFKFGASIGGLIAWGLTKIFKSWTKREKAFIWFGPKIKVTYIRIW